MGFLPKIFGPSRKSVSTRQLQACATSAHTLVMASAQSQATRSERSATELAKLSQPLQLRFGEGGIHYGPLQHGEKAIKEHKQVRDAMVARLKIEHQLGLHEEDDVKTSMAAIGGLKAGFTLQELDAALLPIANAPYSDLVKDMAGTIMQGVRETRRLGAAPASGSPTGVATSNDAVAAARDRMSEAYQGYKDACQAKKARGAAAKREHQRLTKAFKREFAKHPLTKDLKLTPETLYQKVVLDGHTDIDRLVKRLSALQQQTAGITGRQAQKAHAKQLRQVSKELRATIADHTERLALVGACLAKQLAPECHGLMQRPLIQLGACLTAWGQMHLDPDAYWLTQYRKAELVHRQADNLLACHGAHDQAGQVIASADRLRDRAAEDGLAVAVEQSHGWVRHRDEQALNMAEQRAMASTQAFGDVLDSPEADGMLAAIQAAFAGNPTTENLSVAQGSLFNTLWVAQPGALQDLMDELNEAVSLVSVEPGAGEPEAHLRVMRLSRELMHFIAGQIETLATVGNTLATQVDHSSWDLEQQNLLVDCAVDLVVLSAAMALPGSPQRDFFNVALEQYRLAAARLKSLQAVPESTSASSGAPDLLQTPDQPASRRQGLSGRARGGVSPRGGLPASWPEFQKPRGKQKAATGPATRGAKASQETDKRVRFSSTIDVREDTRTRTHIRDGARAGASKPMPKLDIFLQGLFPPEVDAGEVGPNSAQLALGVWLDEGLRKAHGSDAPSAARWVSLLRGMEREIMELNAELDQLTAAAEGDDRALQDAADRLHLVMVSYRKLYSAIAELFQSADDAKHVPPQLRSTVKAFGDGMAAEAQRLASEHSDFTRRLQSVEGYASMARARLNAARGGIEQPDVPLPSALESDASVRGEEPIVPVATVAPMKEPIATSVGSDQPLTLGANGLPTNSLRRPRQDGRNKLKRSTAQPSGLAGRRPVQRAPVKSSRPLKPASLKEFIGLHLGAATDQALRSEGQRRLSQWLNTRLQQVSVTMPTVDKLEAHFDGWRDRIRTRVQHLNALVTAKKDGASIAAEGAKLLMEIDSFRSTLAAVGTVFNAEPAEAFPPELTKAMHEAGADVMKQVEHHRSAVSEMQEWHQAATMLTQALTGTAQPQLSTVQQGVGQPAAGGKSRQAPSVSIDDYLASLEADLPSSENLRNGLRGVKA